MPTFFENESVAVKFEITRAFPTPQYVQNSFGLMVNFSAAITLQQKAKGKVISQMRLAAINNLTIKVSRDTNIPFVGSDHKKAEIKDDSGQVISMKPIYYFSLFPASNYERDDDDNSRLAETHDKFIDELCKEIGEFIEMAQKRKLERKEQPVFVEEDLPSSLRAIRKLSPKDDPKDKAKQKVAPGDIPF